MAYARKRRRAAHSKRLKIHEEETFDNAQNCEPLSDMKTCNYDVKSKESSNLNEQFELSLDDIKSWESFIQFMYRPMDPASLGLIRIMFGFIMVLDIPEERGLADADIKWGDPNECRFPLFNFLQPLPLQWMCIVYLIMWMGALGIMLGLFYHTSCFAFASSYWYIYLLDKTTWNNHSYLYGVISILLLSSKANQYGSLDILLGKAKRNSPVPLWNYFILRFQIFILYFFAGLKKLDKEWLEGYSLRNLGNHWIFEPFKILLTSEQVEFWIIHLNGLAFDLSIGFFLIYNRTRPYALCFLGLFHVINSRLFPIGMFPYVCLATMLIFCDANWPRKIIKILSASVPTVKNTDQNKKRTSSLQPAVDVHGQTVKNLIVHKPNFKIGWKHKLVGFLLISHIGLQLFLPYSHFITKGYNNWTNGLYGYSWDMMVHSWDTVLSVIKVVDHETGREHFLDTEAWVRTERWEKHADMIIQYAQCANRNLLKGINANEYKLSKNISIHLDVWCSLNGRFQQRMFDPRVDLLTVEWSPFKKVSWLMPLLTEFNSWREQMLKLEKEVYSWSEYSDVIFVADFPGLALENYISGDLTNITLTVLEGDVIVEIPENKTVQSTTNMQENISRHRITKAESVSIPAKVFHTVHTVSEMPACYMYSYINHTRQMQAQERSGMPQTTEVDQKKTGLWDVFVIRLQNMERAIGLVSNAVLNVLYSVPMVKRVRVA